MVAVAAALAAEGGKGMLAARVITILTYSSLGAATRNCMQSTHERGAQEKD